MKSEPLPYTRWISFAGNPSINAFSTFLGGNLYSWYFSIRNVIQAESKIMEMEGLTKDEISDILEEIGTLLELKEENTFKIRAYTNGARALRTLDGDIEDLISQDTLKEVKGIGSALTLKITELAKTGELQFYKDLKKSVEPGLIEMLDIPGMGPKKVVALHAQLNIKTVSELETACKDDRVATLPGFGKKTQEKILAGIEYRKQYASHIRLDEAHQLAETIIEELRNHPDVIRSSVAGSFRRSKEIIGDLDFLVSAKDGRDISNYFVSMDLVKDVIAHGETKSSVRLIQGTQADLRVVTDDEFPFALHYFTGSKEHNIGMRQRAIKKGLRLNEYGLFKSDKETKDKNLRVTCRSEEDIFSELGMDFIPPEMREDNGEFELAESSKVPRLIEWTQLKGSLHNHTNWSDGIHSLGETAEYMRELGLQYWAITDHSKSSFQASGLDEKKLAQQVAEIQKINTNYESTGIDFRLLSGTEVDILNEGVLDFQDSILCELDVVVASIHNGFTQSKSVMTKRIIKAIENPNVDILGHMTGRLLLAREPYQLDIKKIIDACAANGTWIELNASPYRLDLDWRHWRHAISKGVKCVINPDAHRNEHAGYLKLATSVARKAGLTPGDVINSLPLNDLLSKLHP